MKNVEKVDLGSVKIHKQVIAEIVENAIKEITGVDLVSKDLASSLSDLFGIKRHAGVLVQIDKNSQVVIDVKVSIRHGMNIQDIARQIQNVIRSAIERTVDIDLRDINVNIQGIERGTK